MNVNDMPTVEDLRAIARAALNAPPSLRTVDDKAFAFIELNKLGRRDVFYAEERRAELIKRGFTPPEDIGTATAPLTVWIMVNRKTGDVWRASVWRVGMQRSRDDVFSDLLTANGLNLSEAIAAGWEAVLFVEVT